MRLTKCLFIFVLCMLVVSCATIIKSSNSKIDLNSKPQGASVYVNGDLRGETPLHLKLLSKGTYTIEFKLEGFPTKTVNVTNHIGAGWLILDVVCGLVPVVVDAVTGSWCALSQKNVTAILEKQQPVPQD